MIKNTDIHDFVRSLSKTFEENYDKLNELDGTLGDGDLGITMRSAFRQMELCIEDENQNLGDFFLKSATAIAAVSSSSFGTLFVSALIAVGKELQTRVSLDWSEVANLLIISQQKMMMTGKGNIGDKSVLDAVESVIESLNRSTTVADAKKNISKDLKNTLEKFKQKKSNLGRARIFGDKTIGLDDPGMVAFSLMVSTALED
jgi:dihydroxyacetone kinase-like protein